VEFNPRAFTHFDRNAVPLYSPLKRLIMVSPMLTTNIRPYTLRLRQAQPLSRKNAVLVAVFVFFAYMSYVSVPVFSLAEFTRYTRI
jgi:hypothetical protein